MPGIIQITIYKEISDPAKLVAYAELAGPAITGAGGVFLARGNPVATKEEGETGRVVIIQWPDMETAKTAFASPAYVEALERLKGGAVRDIRYLEAV